MKSLETARVKEHIICVDDEEGILTALRQQLGARFGDECQIEVAQSAKDALELVDELRREGEPLAVMIADQIMPGMKGVELLEEVHKRSPDTTKILLTGQAGLDAVVAAINRAGLNRYIPKPCGRARPRGSPSRICSKSCSLCDRLPTKTSCTVSHAQERRGWKRPRRCWSRRCARAPSSWRTPTRGSRSSPSPTGSLGLYNHRYLHEQLALAVERSLRSKIAVAMLMIDVDHFKKYNDKNGHPAGDEALRTVARLIAEDRRTVDVVARYGGEEFAILLHDASKQQAIDVAEKIRERVSIASIPGTQGQPLGKMTVSLGVAVCPEDASTAEALLEKPPTLRCTAPRKAAATPSSPPASVRDGVSPEIKSSGRRSEIRKFLFSVFSAFSAVAFSSMIRLHDEEAHDGRSGHWRGELGQ